MIPIISRNVASSSKLFEVHSNHLRLNRFGDLIDLRSCLSLLCIDQNFAWDVENEYLFGIGHFEVAIRLG